VSGSRARDAPETVGERGGAAVTVGSAVGDRIEVGVGGVVAVGVDGAVGVEEVVGVVVVVGPVVAVAGGVGVCVAAATASVGVADGWAVGRGVGPQAARATGRIISQKQTLRARR